MRPGVMIEPATDQLGERTAPPGVQQCVVATSPRAMRPADAIDDTTIGAAETHAKQVARGERFEFGENWRRFLSALSDERIAEARRSLQDALELTSLEGLSMLDIGSGSGLFSLAAITLGAERVHSFDFDPLSVACGRELKRRYAAHAQWTIEPGSVLDRDYVASLGQFDLVYAWGVVHHTGAMFAAMASASLAVAPRGQLLISIYNDQGNRSRRWRTIKRIYNSLPPRLRPPFVIAVMLPREVRAAIGATVRLRPQSYVREWTEYKRQRGMSRWHDAVDWCGGYPFEVAKPEEVFEFYRSRGFTLRKLRTCGGGWACNEFVFVNGHDM